MKKLFLLCLFVSALGSAQTAEQIVQKQVEAYNQKDLNAFMDCYSDDVKIYTFPHTLDVEGKAKMREQFAQFFNSAQTLHCTIVKRIVKGNRIIDEESVQYNTTTFSGVAIYEVKDGKIISVTFLN